MEPSQTFTFNNIEHHIQSDGSDIIDIQFQINIQFHHWRFCLIENLQKI